VFGGGFVFVVGDLGLFPDAVGEIEEFLALGFDEGPDFVGVLHGGS